MFYHTAGSDGTFVFVDEAVTVMEEEEEATICVRLENLLAAESLGCPVTATMQLIDGDNASML